MAKSWFAANFCPRNASCSMTDALKPTNGPAIQTIVYDDPPTEPFPAEIRQFPTPQSFATAYTRPEDWAKCEGQLLEIGPYQVLFSIIGTLYGGDGRGTFGLPDLNNESPNDYYICINGQVPGFVGP